MEENKRLEELADILMYNEEFIDNLSEEQMEELIEYLEQEQLEEENTNNNF